MIDYKKQHKRKEKRSLPPQYKPNETRAKFALPYRQYFLDKQSTETEQKVQKLIEYTTFTRAHQPRPLFSQITLPSSGLLGSWP